MPLIKPWAARRGCEMMYGAPQGAGCLQGTDGRKVNDTDCEGAALLGFARTDCAEADDMNYEGADALDLPTKEYQTGREWLRGSTRQST